MISRKPTFGSVLSLYEILLGLALLPDGKRKWALVGAASQMFENDFAMRCLPFDCEAAEAYALIVSQRNRKGRPISVEDAQIAAIALTADLRLATRNVKDFFEIDKLQIINPWEM
jgi:predicted nucleic acid-binding protein